ncbi:hypothetical protein FS749_013828 [Ceratobasidium sp. UAMH 11750]|nr:hypothetical protein FS749_013828 [Ceratobasidium sp. UAMH 11750]
MDLCNGKDVFLVVGTGEGKSCLIQAPIIADRAAGLKSVGLGLTPTKALANDQARAATNKPAGIRALALHEDSVRSAQDATPPRNLFKEIARGDWDLVFLGPEMLIETSFNDLIHEDGFLKHLCYFTINECHLTREWEGFRSAYARIAHLWNRFPPGIAVWLAMSATVAKRDQAKFTAGLGFSKNRQKCTVLRLPVDRCLLTYAPRIRQHTSNKMLDLATLIPLSATSASDIPITVVFAQRIELGNRLMTFLTNILPKTIQGVARRRLILPYNSMMSAQFRLDAVEALRSGVQTRMLICTDSGAFGIDIAEVQQVVVVVTDPEETFETLCQKHGRIRSRGVAITYFPGWASLQKMGKDDVRMRAKTQPAMIEYANATASDCPRAVNCRYWGEALRAPMDVPCCNRHDPGIDKRHYEELAAREQEHKKGTRRQKNIRSDGTHRPLSKNLRSAAHQLLRQWRSTTWRSCEFRTPICPPNRLISDQLLNHLCKRLHVCTTLDRFRFTLADWDRLDDFGADLYTFCQKLVISTDKLYSPPKKRRKRKLEVEVEDD